RGVIHTSNIMNARHLILLSPYRLPTETALYLGDEEVSAFLNAYSALWHPAALAGAEGPPQFANPYDHEQPQEATLYAVPDNPPPMLPEDWRQRVRELGGVVFRATPDRQETLSNLVEALAEADPEDERLRRLAALPPERIAPFFGLGLGCLQLEALFEAMSHDNVLASGEFWQDVAAAVEALDDEEAAREHIQSAADRLLSAREIVYQVSIYTIDLSFLDQSPGGIWPGAGEAGLPFNVLGCGALVEKLAREQPERMADLREKVAAELAEVIGGPYLEREDPLLPLESQLWNFHKGQSVYQEHL